MRNFAAVIFSFYTLNIVLCRGPSSRLDTIERHERDQVKCPENELYYPSISSCDCSPRYVYFEPDGKCYQAYMRGPCDEGQYLIVAKHERKSRVKCLENPCPDGFVRYQNRCYNLDKSDGACGKAFLQINPYTLEVECTDTSAHWLHVVKIPNICPPGSKRDSSDIC